MSGAVIDQATRDETQLVHGDIDERFFDLALTSCILGWDSETTGLSWGEDRIATVQVHATGATVVVRIGDEVPVRLKALLEDRHVLKVMHHAMFDLRFMIYHWGAMPRGVACTKIASKLAHPEADSREHSLAGLVSRYFGVELDKGQRVTDWMAEDLTEDQLRYAADDVRYLWPLYGALDKEIRERDLVRLRDHCYAPLATRAELELRGYPDVFEY